MFTYNNALLDELPNNPPLKRVFDNWEAVLNFFSRYIAHLQQLLLVKIWQEIDQIILDAHEGTEMEDMKWLSYLLRKIIFFGNIHTASSLNGWTCILKLQITLQGWSIFEFLV